MPFQHPAFQRAAFVALFAIAFAWVETSVVIYLRDLYYPQGFSFPLRQLDQDRLGVELVRELATIIMLAAVGVLAGRTRWERFAHFAIAFGLWDIFFYLWLAVAIGWPASVFDWDILFLLPLPWIGPVIAPVVVSLLLISAGIAILAAERSGSFRPGASAWVLGFAGSALILWTFMRDTNAGLAGAMPQPYAYPTFWTGIVLYVAAIVLSWRSSRSQHPSTNASHRSSPHE
ncbi:MAG: hypothetical protein MUE68_02610 [Bacteroidetes bacterium]|nr:hypothetical protein [Bacteroidota bacterium]